MKAVSLAFTEVRLEDAKEMINIGGGSSVYAVYVLGMLHIYGGDFNFGYTTLKPLRWWKKIADTTVIIDTVRQAIIGMNPRMKGTYRLTLEFPTPNCECDGDDIGKCLKCFLVWNAIRLAELS